MADVTPDHKRRHEDDPDNTKPEPALTADEPTQVESVAESITPSPTRGVGTPELRLKQARERLSVTIKMRGAEEAKYIAFLQDHMGPPMPDRTHIVLSKSYTDTTWTPYQVIGHDALSDWEELGTSFFAHRMQIRMDPDPACNSCGSGHCEHTTAVRKIKSGLLLHPNIMVVFAPSVAKLRYVKENYLHGDMTGRWIVIIPPSDPHNIGHSCKVSLRTSTFSFNR